MPLNPAPPDTYTLTGCSDMISRSSVCKAWRGSSQTLRVALVPYNLFIGLLGSRNHHHHQVARDFHLTSFDTGLSLKMQKNMIMIVTTPGITQSPIFGVNWLCHTGAQYGVCGNCCTIRPEVHKWNMATGTAINSDKAIDLTILFINWRRLEIVWC